MNFGAGNIRYLYVFFMKFKVFTYAVNPVENFRKGRSVTGKARAGTLETFRLFRLGTRIASFLLSQGLGVLFIPTKEKVPAALAALQWFPA